MAYEPTVWKNRVVERPLTFNMVNNPDGTVTLVPAPGVIVESGTPVNAVNLNKLEQGLKTHEADNVQQTNEGQIDIPHGLQKCKFDATVPPTTSDDITKNYSIGSKYYDGKTIYVCLRSEVNRAVWVPYAELGLIYDYGNEYINFAEGFTLGTGSLVKTDEYLNAKVNNNPANQAEYVFSTVLPIDFMGKNKLFVEWENAGSGSNSRAYLLIGESNSVSVANKVAEKQIVNTFSKQISELDVSTLNGIYYIGISARDNSPTSNNPVDLKVYKIWMR